MKITTFKYGFVPAKNTSSRKLMIVLHGLGDSFYGYTWLPEELNQPNLNYLLLNAPDLYYEGFSWYNYEDALRAPKDILRNRQLLFELLEELKEDNWRTEDIILFGFSQGCVMCFELGLRYPEAFAGICGISGYLAEGSSNSLENEISRVAYEQNWLVTHGYQDQVIAYARAVEDIEYLKRLNIPVQFYSFNKGHTIDPYEELPLIQKWVEACF
jgi:phospholipase/carboxylesterase